MSTRTCRESGFTLVEVLVAFSILAVGVLGVNAMLMNASQHEQYAASARTANRLAMKKLEELRSLGDTQDTILAKDGDLEMDTPTTDKDEKFGGFVIQYAVTPTGQSNALLGKVTVGWGGQCNSCIPGNAGTYVSPDGCKYKTAVTSIVFTRNTE